MKTYVITDPTDLPGFTGAIVTDALTGRAHAACGSHRVPLGVPLCDGCDEPVGDGPCGCRAPTEAERSVLYCDLIGGTSR
jgi:hypothetical protein